jgi:hypothetical protein
MDQMSIKYTNIFHWQGPPKLTQIWIFGLKTYHLATLLTTANSIYFCSTTKSYFTGTVITGAVKVGRCSQEYYGVTADESK